VVDVKTLNDFAHERVESVRFDSDARGVVEYEPCGRNEVYFGVRSASSLLDGFRALDF
jgi:hypothetical protein